MQLRHSLLAAAFVLFAACSQPKQKAAEKQYPLTGKIVAIDMKEHTATIDAAAIPNYMEAMKMDYPIASTSDLAALRVGEQIRAMILVADDGSYKLANISEAGK